MQSAAKLNSHSLVFNNAFHTPAYRCSYTEESLTMDLYGVLIQPARIQAVEERKTPDSCFTHSRQADFQFQDYMHAKEVNCVLFLHNPVDLHLFITQNQTFAQLSDSVYYFPDVRTLSSCFSHDETITALNPQQRQYIHQVAVNPLRPLTIVGRYPVGLLLTFCKELMQSNLRQYTQAMKYLAIIN